MSSTKKEELAAERWKHIREWFPLRLSFPARLSSRYLSFTIEYSMLLLILHLLPVSWLEASTSLNLLVGLSSQTFLPVYIYVLQLQCQLG